MKKICVLGMLFAFAVVMFAQPGPSPKILSKNKFGQVTVGKGNMMSVNLMGLKKAARDVTPQDLLGCTEGTVFGHEYTDDVTWSGSASADAGRPDYGMEFYQYFEGCYNTFNNVSSV